ncbi:hypothetical protein ACXJJ3_42290 (plasmid) [Kribbella sp. WER1]
MRVRFTVRPDDDQPGRFAVWDGGTNGWRARGLADEPAATRKAAELELQYDAHGQRNPATVRQFGNHQQKVQIKHVEWSPPVELYAWLRTDGEWYGLVCDAAGRMTFVPGSELRPNES